MRELRAPIQNVLAVVQHEQERAVTKTVRKLRQWRRPRLMLQAERSGYGGGNEFWIVQTGKLDEPDTAWE